MAITSAILEFSRDPLSDTTPTWIDVSAYLIEAEWFSGKANELDAPQAGGASFRLKNSDRRFEPDYAAGAYYPDIDVLRRWRLTVSDGTTSSQEGVWYATDYEIVYPSFQAYSEVIVTCADGFELLSLDNLELLDPPDASSYEEVGEFDDPSFYYRLGEPQGTKLVSKLRSKRWRRNHPNRPKRRRFRVTRAELGGVSGPSGTYKNTPTLGEPGAILGDPDTAVKFDATASEYASIPLEESLTSTTLTLEAWIKSPSVGAWILAGPTSTANPSGIWELFVNASGRAAAGFHRTDGTSVSVSGTTLLAAAWYHLAATWDGMTARIYVNGSLEGTQTGSGTLDAGDAGSFIWIGAFGTAGGSTGGHFNGWIDEPAVYEKALSESRIQAHHTAGSARGFDEQTAGARIAALATHDLWSEAKIQTGSFNVQPTMKYGQSRLDEIIEAVDAEQPRSLFFFDSDGDPVYLGWDYQAASPYNTPQTTLGDDGSEIRYQDIQIEYDAEVFNDVTVSRDGGVAQNAIDQDSIDARKRRAYADTGLILSDDDDAATIAAALLEELKDPAFRPVTVTMNGAALDRSTQILTRQIGDLVRVKRRGEGGTPIDRVTHILGYRKHLSRDLHLTCTWNLARGFNAGAGQWQLGITGFSELDTGTVLA